MASIKSLRRLSTVVALGVLAVSGGASLTACKFMDAKKTSDVNARNFDKPQNPEAAGKAVMALYEKENDVWAYKPNHDRYVTKMRIQVSKLYKGRPMGDPRDWVQSLGEKLRGKASVKPREAEKQPFRQLGENEQVLGATTTDYFLNEKITIDDPDAPGQKLEASLNKRQRTYADLIADPDNDLRADFYENYVEGGKNVRMAKMSGSFDANKVPFTFDEFKVNWKRDADFFPIDSIMRRGGGVKENKKSIAILMDLNRDWNSVEGQNRFASIYLAEAAAKYGAAGQINADAFKVLTEKTVAQGGFMNPREDIARSFLASVRAEVDRAAGSPGSASLMFGELQEHMFNHDAMNVFLNDTSKQPADRLIVLNAALAPYHAFKSAKVFSKSMTLDDARALLASPDAQAAALKLIEGNIAGLNNVFKDSLGAIYKTSTAQKSILENLGYDSFDLIYRQFYSRVAYAVKFGDQNVEMTFDSQIRYFVQDGVKPDGSPNFVEASNIGEVDDVVAEMKFPSAMAKEGYTNTLNEDQRHVLRAIDDQKNIYQEISPGNLGKKGFGFQQLGEVIKRVKGSDGFKVVDADKPYFKSIPEGEVGKWNLKGIGKFIFQFGDREWLRSLLTQAQ